MFNLQTITPEQLEVTTEIVSKGQLYLSLVNTYLAFNSQIASAKFPLLALAKTINTQQLGVIFGEDLTISSLAITIACLGLETEICPISEIKSIAGIKYILFYFNDVNKVIESFNQQSEEIDQTTYLQILEEKAKARSLANSQQSDLPLPNLALTLLNDFNKVALNLETITDFPLQLKGLDVALLESVPNINQRGFYCSDMDMTAVQAECIDELAAIAGVGEQVAAITHKAMEGNLDFIQSLRERVATLAGHKVEIIDQVKNKIQAMPGLDYLCAYLNKHKWISAIVSGGFNDFTSALTEQANINYYYSNELEKANGKFTGKLIGKIVDAQQKAKFLNKIASKKEVPINQIIAIGDGANDLCMMNQAGCSIAYHAKPKVQAKAKVNLKFTDLRGVIVILQAKHDSQKKEFKTVEEQIEILKLKGLIIKDEKTAQDFFIEKITIL